jgi:hypothetical protein
MDDSTRFDLADGMELAGIGVREVWWRYTAFGGQADPQLLGDRISGGAKCSNGEHDLIAQALNEIFFDHGMDTFPVGYKEPFRALPESPLPSSSAAEDRQHKASPRAAEARRRSAAAAHQAAELHLTAARLMRDSGQLRLDSRAHVRAFTAFTRSRHQA